MFAGKSYFVTSRKYCVQIYFVESRYQKDLLKQSNEVDLIRYLTTLAPAYQCRRSRSRVKYGGHGQSGQAIKLFQITSYVDNFQTLNNPGSWSRTRTVVRECCKGNDASQWGNGQLDPLPYAKTPEPIVTKSCVCDYVEDIYQHAKM